MPLLACPVCRVINSNNVKYYGYSTFHTFGSVSMENWRLICLESKVSDVPLEFFKLVPFVKFEDVWVYHDLNLTHEKIFFHSSLASAAITHKNRKIKNPWSELNKVNKIWNVSRSAGVDRIVSIANSQVSPKIDITPPRLIIKRIMLFLSTASFFSAAEVLKCRMSTTTTQTKMIMLKTMTSRSGPRNAPQKAATWDRKQLWKHSVKISVNF